jgi:hypothetical protein
LEAELQRWDKVFDPSFTDISNVKSKEEAEAFFEKFRVIATEGMEILEWIFPQKPLSSAMALDIASRLRALKVSEDIWKGFIKKAEKRERGRPITKRQIAIKALEKQILEPKRKWSPRQLAQQFCNCDKPSHDARCGETLRQSIRQLKKVLARYCPTFTP